MKKGILLFLFSVILTFSCHKDDSELIVPDNKLPYIKNFILVDTVNAYKGEYYIHVSFKDTNNSDLKEITFFKSKQKEGWSSIQSIDNTVLGTGWVLIDTTTTEKLEIDFHYNIADTTFKLCYANYRFANPWKNITGVNICYYKPVQSSAYTFYMYIGINSSNSFFKINYIGEDRINGYFQTIWQECCGEGSVYSVTGDFSIPRIIP